MTAAAIGSPFGEPQIWKGDSAYIVLGRVRQVAEVASGTAKFRIYMPDSRLRVKSTVLFVRNPGQTAAVTALGATLYLGEEEEDRQTGGVHFCTDILRDTSGNVIHQSAPLAIPEDTGLEGYTQEFVTAADSIGGILTSTNNTSGTEFGFGPLGTWVLQLRFQPDGQRLCDPDWEWLKRKCHATRLGAEFSL